MGWGRGYTSPLRQLASEYQGGANCWSRVDSRTTKRGERRVWRMVNPASNGAHLSLFPALRAAGPCEVIIGKIWLRAIPQAILSSPDGPGRGSNRLWECQEVVGSSTPSTRAEPGPPGLGRQAAKAQTLESAPPPHPTPPPPPLLHSGTCSPGEALSRKKGVITERDTRAGHPGSRTRLWGAGKADTQCFLELEVQGWHPRWTGVPGRQELQRVRAQPAGGCSLLVAYGPGRYWDTRRPRTTSPRSPCAGGRAGQGPEAGVPPPLQRRAGSLRTQGPQGSPRGCRDAEIRETGEDWGR